jgi:hypothetical protein
MRSIISRLRLLDATDISIGLLSSAAIWMQKGIRALPIDGDTVVSAAQFQKLVHFQLFGTPDSGTGPKLLMIAVSGLSYVLSGGFDLLRALATVFMAWFSARLSKEFRRQGTSATFFPVFLLMAIPWSTVVLTADNPAFSVPLICLALLAAQESRFTRALVLFTAAQLFRPGAELIAPLILWIAVREFRWQPAMRKKTIAIGTLVLAIMFLHLKFGYLLGYRTWNDYLAECVDYPPGVGTQTTMHARYYHRLTAFAEFGRYYFDEVILKTHGVLLLTGLGGAALATFRRSRVLYLGLIPLSGLLVPLGGALGGFMFLQAPYFSDFSLVCSIFAAWGAGTLAAESASVFPRLSRYPMPGVLAALLGIYVLLNAPRTEIPARTDFKARFGDDSVARSELRKRYGTTKIRLLASVDGIGLMLGMPDMLSSLHYVTEMPTLGRNPRHLWDPIAQFWVRMRPEDLEFRQIENEMPAYDALLIHSSQLNLAKIARRVFAKEAKVDPDRLLFMN